MNMEVTGNARLGVQQAEVARTGRLGSRAIEAGQAQGARVGSRSGGFFRGVKALASRALDVMTPANVRVQKMPPSDGALIVRWMPCARAAPRAYRLSAMNCSPCARVSER